MLKRSNIFSNNTINKKELKKIIEWAFKNYGQRKAAYFVDQLKEMGFEYATKSGISISIEDLRIPPVKIDLMRRASFDAFLTEAQAKNGEITEVERFQRIIYIWNTTSEELKERLIEFFKKTDPLNSVYIMAFSGARGNIAQVRQLVGMRGLMSDPSGRIIDRAIGANFREGLSITDYIISSYGARKGLVDTAIKTADSGYLTRRLVEVAQSIIISELDCKTERGIFLQESVKDKDEKGFLPLTELLNGRVLASSIFKPGTKKIIAFRNQEITSSLVENLIKANITKVLVRSPLTCECRRAVCQHCYGWNLALGNLVELGETVGLIAAQSIGEPGTQLTMRTFHTGGVFTSELIRQGRVNYSGYLDFMSELKLCPYRTEYGQAALLSENNSWLGIITYENKIIRLPIPEDTIIFSKNHKYITDNQVLLEAAPKMKEMTLGEKEIKYVNARHPGQIFLEENSCPQDFLTQNIAEFRKRGQKNYSFWVLSGEVLPTAFDTIIRARILEKIYKDQSIAQSKIVTTIGGFVRFSRNKSTQELLGLKTQNTTREQSIFKIFIESNHIEISNCKVYLSHTYQIILKPQLINKRLFSFGSLCNNKYKTKTGGNFYISNLYKPRPIGKKLNNKVKSGSTIFYLPKATIRTGSNEKEFKFKKGSYVKKHDEIFPDYFISINGFINFDIAAQTKSITIKPGEKHRVDKELKFYTDLNEQIYYPGELILDKFEVTVLSYIEFESNAGKTFLYIRPITRYEFTNEYPRQILNSNYFAPLNLIVEDFKVQIISGQEIKIDKPIQFIESPLIIDYSLDLDDTELVFEFKKPEKKNSPSKINFIYSQICLFDTVIPKEIKKTDIEVNLLVEEKQFTDPYTIIGAFDTLSPFNNTILSIKKKCNRVRSEILLTTKTDYREIFLDSFSHQYEEKKFFKTNKLFNNDIIIREDGLLKEVKGNKLVLHLGQSYFFSNGALVRKIPGDYIRRQETLGQLIFERLITGDIVQGLPKINNILEARKPKIESLLSTRPGFINSIRYTSNFIVIGTKPSIKNDYYKASRSQRLVVRKYESVSVGQPLTQGSLNPHTLLHVYFRYFCSLGLLSTYESAYRSLKKLQGLLLTSVQAIYVSQGVMISSKHVELIVREMTHKVYVESPGKTNFLPGDIIDLEQAQYINLCIKNNNQLGFRPILLGITKSSLKTDSFLAAASFQETTRVLTGAAIQGKTDWLRGLKENAITGRLIPAGTGFYINKDITFTKVLVPEKSANEEQNLTLKAQLKVKEAKLKKLVRFKYNK
uniref:DNA-directed RNA polymerase n=1 Tax=Ectocarpus siliculosus TaxID=2880 RepID=D1J789_ECTSI|nr:Plastid-encoded DNA-directed RNA polymerase subunit beta'' [Ectocarpus siliculosus]CAT18812.1 Plastid-encoded DNA-directed RNA polymerase subunit beta'' [Ectocarpus siliculosus]CAV31273.1 Plastid-encoded DNA-directed RNA polymerase subunit beta'' [Ectocarpus siliculosus]